MSPEQQSGHDSSRVEVLQVIKTPLTFFALALLVVEVLFGIVAASVTGADRTLSIVAMLLLFCGLIAVVAYFAYSRPEALSGSRDSAFKTAPLQDEIQRLRQANDNLSARTLRLEEEKKTVEARIERLVSLRLRILAVLGNRSLSPNEIVGILTVNPNPVSPDEIISLIGALFDEGRIEPDRARPDGYYRVKST